MNTQMNYQQWFHVQPETDVSKRVELNQITGHTTSDKCNHSWAKDFAPYVHRSVISPSRNSVEYKNHRFGLKFYFVA